MVSVNLIKPELKSGGTNKLEKQRKYDIRYFLDYDYKLYLYMSTFNFRLFQFSKFINKLIQTFKVQKPPFLS